MNNDNTSIHNFDFDLICEYFSYLQRQGPGSPEATIMALNFLEPITEPQKIADIGCGTGGQTMLLARHIRGEITGIDLFPVFIDIFNRNAARLNLHNWVHGIVGSMDNLPFRDEELDIIWSEGAIYNIGFEKGLRYWNRFLKKGGYIAVTEATWFTDERPDEIEAFWNDAYPEIDTIPNKAAILQKAGFLPVAMFTLPENCWTENFYKPQVMVQDDFLARHTGNQTAVDLVNNMKHEAMMYQKYGRFYGYTFFIGKKL